jgi:Tol biopolymer transport system component
MKTPVTDGNSNERQPSWTADGGQILFHSDRQGRYEVYVMESNILKPRRLAEANMDTQEITTAGRAYSP